MPSFYYNLDFIRYYKNKIDSKLGNPKIKSKKSLVVTKYFKEKEKEEMMNETSIQSSENLSYSQLFQQKSFIRLLDDEKSSFSESKYNFLPNIRAILNLNQQTKLIIIIKAIQT